MPARPSRTDDLTVTPSILDRLIDLKPTDAADEFTTRAKSIRELKAALRRDLEWLLNTRRIPDEAPESMEELPRSLYNYGLPDFSHANIRSVRDRHWLAVEIETTVRRFEPRLKDIRVNVREDALSHTTRILQLQIEGMLIMDPAPEQISFDTVLELSSGEYQIRGDRGA